MANLPGPTRPIKTLPSGPLDRLLLGARGALRMGQVAGAVYPRAIKWLYGRRKPAPAEVRELFESLGVTYIKFGQFIASSPSLFPPEYVQEFQKCLDQTPPVPFAKIEQILQREFDRPLEQLFAWIDHKPLATASIAQVHAARLHSGEAVVLKVQKPGVESIMTTDLNAVFLMTRLMELVTPGMDKASITDLVSEVYKAMLDECDFEKEAANLMEFQQFLSRTDNQSVVVPYPYRQLTTRKVLTMERIHGVAITDPAVLQRAQGDAVPALFAALNTWFASLRECEAFHADLHSGNILLRDDGSVAFIDFGMVGRVSPTVWQALFMLFKALENEDYPLMAKAMADVGMTRAQVDTDALARDIKALYQGFSQQAFNAAPDAELGATQFLNDLTALAAQYGIRFPRSFTLLVKQFLYFDRYLQLLAPGANLFDDPRMDSYF